MIEYKKGNLLDVTEGIIVHGCNAQGIMGSGVAKAIREKYPECFDQYRLQYEVYTLILGDIVWWCQVNQNGDGYHDDLYIANAITQEFYGTDRRHVNYCAIATVFKEIFRQANVVKATVHFPKIGAGLGGGNWDIIEAIINDCDPENRVKKICWEL